VKALPATVEPTLRTLLGQVTTVLGVGVDLECDRRPNFAMGRFFLAPEELQWVQACGEGQQPDELLRLWTCKEALFKANPANGGRLLIDHLLLDPAATIGAGACRFAEDILFRYASIAVANGYCTFAVAGR